MASTFDTSLCPLLSVDGRIALRGSANKCRWVGTDTTTGGRHTLTTTPPNSGSSPEALARRVHELGTPLLQAAQRYCPGVIQIIDDIYVVDKSGESVIVCVAEYTKRSLAEVGLSSPLTMDEFRAALKCAKLFSESAPSVPFHGNLGAHAVCQVASTNEFRIGDFALIPGSANSSDRSVHTTQVLHNVFIDVLDTPGAVSVPTAKSLNVLRMEVKKSLVVAVNKEDTSSPSPPSAASSPKGRVFVVGSSKSPVRSKSRPQEDEVPFVEISSSSDDDDSLSEASTCSLEDMAKHHQEQIAEEEEGMAKTLKNMKMLVTPAVAIHPTGDSNSADTVGTELYISPLRTVVRDVDVRRQRSLDSTRAASPPPKREPSAVGRQSAIPTHAAPRRVERPGGVEYQAAISRHKATLAMSHEKKLAQRQRDLAGVEKEEKGKKCCEVM